MLRLQAVRRSHQGNFKSSTRPAPVDLPAPPRTRDARLEAPLACHCGRLVAGIHDCHLNIFATWMSVFSGVRFQVARIMIWHVYGPGNVTGPGPF